MTVGNISSMWKGGGESRNFSSVEMDSMDSNYGLLNKIIIRLLEAHIPATSCRQTCTSETPPYP